MPIWIYPVGEGAKRTATGMRSNVFMGSSVKAFPGEVEAGSPFGNATIKKNRAVEGLEECETALFEIALLRKAGRPGAMLCFGTERTKKAGSPPLASFPSMNACRPEQKSQRGRSRSRTVLPVHPWSATARQSQSSAVGHEGQISGHVRLRCKWLTKR
ncbi:hypothetical protein RHIZ404_220166 [Rhizobium sp. EC-SD404]|nr:hypothetical protein RHIZ404_220166 [Rhizobium sp. EC-SD404]